MFKSSEMPDCISLELNRMYDYDMYTEESVKNSKFGVNHAVFWEIKL